MGRWPERNGGNLSSVRIRGKENIEKRQTKVG